MRLRSFRRSAFLFIAFVLLFISGLFDHFLEISFDEFAWSDHLGTTFKEIPYDVSEISVNHFYNQTKKLILPRCKTSSDKTYNLLIVVKSAVTNSKNREAIRKTWGSVDVVNDFGIRTLFVVGRFSSIKLHKSMNPALQREAEIYEDILQLDVADTYRNNTWKFIHSVEYAHQGCQQPDFVLLLDDDYMLSISHLMKVLDEKSSADPIYEGWRFDTTPFRFRLHKHSVPLSEYPYDRYPAYISAGAVLLSRHTIGAFYAAIPSVKVYSFDDIYAGILAHLLHIEPHHNDRFLFWSRDVTHEEWIHGKVIAAHGYSSQKMEDEYPLVKFGASG